MAGTERGLAGQLRRRGGEKAGSQVSRPGRGDSATRTRILQGAARCYAAGGIDTRVEDILRASGISRRTFYQYFSGKNEVLGVLFQNASEVLVDRLAAAASGGSPMERIEKVVDCYLDLLVSAGPLGDVMQSEAARPGSPLGPQRRKTLDTLVAHFQAAAGAFDRRIDPLVFRTLLLAAESVCLQMRSSGQLNPAATKRVRLVLLRIAQATLAAGDDQVAGLPGS